VNAKLSSCSASHSPKPRETTSSKGGGGCDISAMVASLLRGGSSTQGAADGLDGGVVVGPFGNLVDAKAEGLDRVTRHGAQGDDLRVGELSPQGGLAPRGRRGLDEVSRCLAAGEKDGVEALASLGGRVERAQQHGGYLRADRSVGDDEPVLAPRGHDRVAQDRAAFIGAQVQPALS